MRRQANRAWNGTAIPTANPAASRAAKEPLTRPPGGRRPAPRTRPRTAPRARWCRRRGHEAEAQGHPAARHDPPSCRAIELAQESPRRRIIVSPGTVSHRRRERLLAAHTRHRPSAPTHAIIGHGRGRVAVLHCVAFGPLVPSCAFAYQARNVVEGCPRSWSESAESHLGARAARESPAVSDRSQKPLPGAVARRG